jgi:hypothetical protein
MSFYVDKYLKKKLFRSPRHCYVAMEAKGLLEACVWWKRQAGSGAALFVH